MLLEYVYEHKGKLRTIKKFITDNIEIRDACYTYCTKGELKTLMVKEAIVYTNDQNYKYKIDENFVSNNLVVVMANVGIDPQISKNKIIMLAYKLIIKQKLKQKFPLYLH